MAYSSEEDVYEATGMNARVVKELSGKGQTLTFEALGYVDCVTTDIGRAVVGVTTGDTGTLRSYNNTTRKWTVIQDDYYDLFDQAESITITGGTGAGTTTGASSSDVTALIDGYIAKADARIKRLLRIPITIRKELHAFDGRNYTVELGPDQDEYEVFDFDPANCVDKIYALYSFSKRRIKLPYPKDCDELTEDITYYTSSNVILSTEETEVKCGDGSIKAEWTADDGYFAFPNPANLNKSIYPWSYVGFWFRTSDADAKFKLRLYNTTTYNEWEFQLELPNVWYIVSVPLTDFDTKNISWSDAGEKCQQIQISCDTSGTIAYFDNFNFNEGFFWTYPEGLLCWSKDQDDQYPTDTLYVTYCYDPYKDETPVEITDVSAKLAGVSLLNYLIGIRISTVDFEQMSESVEFDADREVLTADRNRLAREAEEALASIGYGFTVGFSGS